MQKDYNKLLLVIFTGIAIGSSIVFARFALKEISPFPLTVLRFGIASLVFFIAFVVTNKKFILNPGKFKHIAVVGILSTGLPILLYYYSLSYISSGIFTIFFSSVPIFTALFARIFLKTEKLSNNLIFGLIIAFAGVIILIYTKSSGLTGGVYTVKGPLFVLLGALSTAIGIVYSKSRLNKEDPFLIGASQTLAAFIFVAIIVFATGNFHVGKVSPFGWFSVFYNGLVGSFTAISLTFALIKKYGAVTSSLPSYVTPVVSTFLGMALLKEVITLPLLLGALLTLTGVYFSTK